MSTLKADTIQSTSGGAATLTKQQAAKFWVAYDATGDSIVGSFNHASLTDVGTGEHAFSFTNNFGSATNKAPFASVFNSVNGTGIDAGADRAGNTAVIGGMTNFRALSASEIYVSTAYKSRAASDGALADYKAVYCTVIGDLA